MTADEKEKLYTAIGYSGSSHNLALPKQVSTPAGLFRIYRLSAATREQEISLNVHNSEDEPVVFVLLTKGLNKCTNHCL